MNKWIARSGGIITAICIFAILLISSAEYCIYYREDFYSETFAKYNIPEEAQMEMPEILRLTRHLTAYLRGNEDSLDDFTAVVNGTKRPFYSEREKLHMQDVQQLFIGALKIRRICFITCIATVCIMCILGRRITRTYVRSIFISLIGIACAVTGLFVYILSDFNRAFIGFHHLLFDNDLWLLNPESDWIIRLLPEGFFSDMAISIGSIFAITLACTLAVCGLFLAGTHTKDRNKRPDNLCEI